MPEPGSGVTIYHNPACGTSRNTLGLIRDSGAEPRIVEYLKTPPPREELVHLIRRMGIPVRDLLRRKGTPYDELGGAGRPRAERRPARRRDDGPPDPDQPADRGDAARGQALPAVGSGARPRAGPAARRVRQGGRRARGRRGRPARDLRGPSLEPVRRGGGPRGRPIPG